MWLFVASKVQLGLARALFLAAAGQSSRATRQGVVNVTNGNQGIRNTRERRKEKKRKEKKRKEKEKEVSSGQINRARWHTLVSHQ